MLHLASKNLSNKKYRVIKLSLVVKRISDSLLFPNVIIFVVSKSAAKNSKYLSSLGSITKLFLEILARISFFAAAIPSFDSKFSICASPIFVITAM